jgi:hypothetical protein
MRFTLSQILAFVSDKKHSRPVIEVGIRRPQKDILICSKLNDVILECPFDPLGPWEIPAIHLYAREKNLDD